MADYPKIATFKTAESFRNHLNGLKLEFEVDDAILAAPGSPLAASVEYHGRTIGNRWCILPMEGWECLPDGAPSELTRRRWMRFAESGAKLLFGCEACAVMESGKSNTRQLMITPATMPALKEICVEMRKVHAAKFGTADDLYIGLQLTHSGRYSHPHDDAKLESVTAYSHPLLDERFHSTPANVVSDAELRNIIDRFVAAAKLAKEAGFDFVDVKMAHGYLGHELLSAYDRPGEFGGSFENRTRFFREIVQRIQKEVPGLEVGTRFSICDFLPYEKGADKVGIPMERNGVGVGNYKYAFGGDGTGLGWNLEEPIRFLELCRSLGVELICATVGSPYYNPHIQRPAYFPVSDGYLPPEDPVIGADRHIKVLAEVKEHFKNTGMLFICAGLTCLQEFLPQAAQAAVRSGKFDFAGMGRMVIAYPEMPADSLAGGPLQTKRICRTFGDCTTAPRNGMVSGCYPLDEFYRAKPECKCVQELKKKFKS